MIATEYTYEASENGNVQTAVITQLKSGRTKEFTMIAKSFKGLISHMESLSDEACSNFFPEPKKPKNK